MRIGDVKIGEDYTWSAAWKGGDRLRAVDIQHRTGDDAWDTTRIRRVQVQVLDWNTGEPVENQLNGKWLRAQNLTPFGKVAEKVAERARIADREAELVEGVKGALARLGVRAKVQGRRLSQPSVAVDLEEAAVENLVRATTTGGPIRASEEDEAW